MPTHHCYDQPLSADPTATAGNGSASHGWRRTSAGIAGAGKNGNEEAEDKADSSVWEGDLAAWSFREKVEHLVFPRVAGGIAKKPEEDTLKKFLMLGALAFAATGIVQTVSAAEYYVVRDATTKKCTVVDSKPTTTTTTVVGDSVYKTKTEAESGIKTTKVCTEQ
jgi:hypothetical protein